MKDPAAAAAADSKPAKKTKTAPAFEFTGKVESLNVKGDGPATSHQCLFSLAHGKGEHHAYLLDRSDMSRYLAMLSVLTTAYAQGAKVAINARDNGGAPRIAIELEIRR